MDFIGFLIGTLLTLFPPLILREQVEQAGEDMHAWAVNRLPWHMKRVKSFFVGRLLTYATAQLISIVFWAYAVLHMEPELLQNPFVFWSGIVAGPVQWIFAVNNYLCGRLRFQALAPTTPEQRAEAARTMALAVALRETAESANQHFEAVCRSRDMLIAPTRGMIMVAMAASQANVQLAAAYAAAARAQEQVHRVSAAFSCTSHANKIVQRLARIVAQIPGHAALDLHFNQAADHASQAAQAAERAMVEEDQRVFVLGPGTSFSLPQYWAVMLLVSQVVLGVSMDVYSVGVGDCWLFAMGFVPLAMAWSTMRVTVEIFAWLWVKVVKMLEFVTTKFRQSAAVVIPGETLGSVQDARVELFNEEQNAASAREWINTLGTMGLPYKAVVFWLTLPGVAIVMASATAVAIIFSLAYITRGKKAEVDESETRTIGFFWKYGKLITIVVLFAAGSSVEWDGFMNRLAGITPMVVVTGKTGWYLVFSLISLVMMRAMWKFAKANKGWSEKVLKPAAVFAGIVFLCCLLAPISRAATGGKEIFKFSERTGPEAEKPVQMTPATIQFRPMANGRQEMIITFYSLARQAKGVVRFDPQLAAQLGVESDHKVTTYSGYANCGGKRCRQHEVRIPELTSRPHGSFVVVMRRYLSVEVGEWTFI